MEKQQVSSSSSFLILDFKWAKVCDSKTDLKSAGPGEIVVESWGQISAINWQQHFKEKKFPCPSTSNFLEEINLLFNFSKKKYKIKYLYFANKTIVRNQKATYKALIIGTAMYLPSLLSKYVSLNYWNLFVQLLVTNSDLALGSVDVEFSQISIIIDLIKSLNPVI